MCEQSIESNRQESRQKSNGSADVVQPSEMTESQPLDPFDDLDKLRASQDFRREAEVKPQFTMIAVQKPGKFKFMRTLGGEKGRFEAGILTDPENGDAYLVTPSLWEVAPNLIRITCLVLSIFRNSKVPFLWPIPMAGPDGRLNPWHESAFETARIAEEKWVRIESDMTAGCYVPHVAMGDIPDPIWPQDLEMRDYLRLAFRDRLIDDPNHLMFQKLRGEV